MVFRIPQHWDVALDGIQIVLCLLIIVFLFRSYKKNRQSVLEDGIGESGPSFNVQILNQTLKQQIDQGFGNIADTIAAEQRKLNQVMSNSGSADEVHETRQYQPFLHQSAAPDMSSIGSDTREPSGREPLHEQIREFAAKGMSARQISEKLKTPLGEVELIMSLRASMAG